MWGRRVSSPPALLTPSKSLRGGGGGGGRLGVTQSAWGVRGEEGLGGASLLGEGGIEAEQSKETAKMETR